jgi:hypothetical protein
VTHLKADALHLAQVAAKIAEDSMSGNIATAAASAIITMSTEGPVDPDTSAAYALVMEELFASGALRVGAPRRPSRSV